MLAKNAPRTGGSTDTKTADLPSLLTTYSAFTAFTVYSAINTVYTRVYNKIPAVEVIYQKAGNLIGPKTKLFQTFSKFLFPAGFGIFSYVEDKSQLRKK